MNAVPFLNVFLAIVIVEVINLGTKTSTNALLYFSIFSIFLSFYFFTLLVTVKKLLGTIFLKHIITI